MSKPFSEFTDIGGGHQIRISYDENGEPWLLEDWHTHFQNREGLCSVSIEISTDPNFKGYQNKTIWYWDPETYSIDPSIKCTACREHGWIKQGHWGFGFTPNTRMGGIGDRFPRAYHLGERIVNSVTDCYNAIQAKIKSRTKN